MWLISNYFFYVYVTPVPSVARNLAITILTQSRVNATWTQPADPNGDPSTLRYRVEYGLNDGDGRKSTTSFGDVREVGGGEFSVTIDNLEQDEEYEFKVSFCDRA